MAVARFTYRLIVSVILLQVACFIAGAILFGVYKKEIHHGIERALGQDVLHGDSLHIEDLDYGSTLLLQPRLKLDHVQVWGLDARDLPAVFDIEQINIDLSWLKTFSMLWEASEFSWSRPIFLIRNDLVRIRLQGLHLINGKIIMHRTEDGHNHRLFRPPMERILKFASGEMKMAGGFEINNFTVENVFLDYLKTEGNNPDEALPKVYKIQIDDLSMKLSSDSTKTGFDDFRMAGTIGSIRVRDNEGLVGRSFKASGSADLRKLSLSQKLQDDTGFDLVSDNLKVEFKGLEVTAAGILSTLNERMRLDIDFQSLTGTNDKTNESLLSFLELALSDRFLSVIKSYDPLGELEFDGRIFSKNNEYGGSIRIDLKYLARDTSFKFRFFENGERHVVNNLELNGLFQVGGDTASYISANIAEGELYEGQHFQAEIILDNVFRREFLDSLEQLRQPPLASVKFDSYDIEFKGLLEFMEFKKFQGVAGTIDFENFHFSGPISSLSKSYGDLDYGGNFRMNGLAFNYDNEHLPIAANITNANGKVTLAKNRAIPLFDFTLNGQPIQIESGEIRDFIPYVLNQDREHLMLDHFLIKIPGLVASELLEDYRQMMSPQDQPASLGDMSKLLDKIKRHVNTRSFTLEFPEINVDSIYLLDSINGYYPRGFDESTITIEADIGNNVSATASWKSAVDTIAFQTVISQNSELSALSNITTSISDVADFACRIGIPPPLGQHLDVPFTFNSDLTTRMSLEEEHLTVDFGADEFRLKNSEMDIDARISEFNGSFQVKLDTFSILPPAEFSLAVDLDDETLVASFRTTEDSLQISTQGEQQLKFQTAKKYLSLFCEINQNLSRLDNLDGEMSFQTVISEHTGEHGLDVLMNASRIGTFDINGLSFDFLKGGEAIHFDNINAQIEYDDQGISINDFKGNYLDSDFHIFDTRLQGLLEFVLLGEPLAVDTMHIRSEVLDLVTLFEVNGGSGYRCEVIENRVEEPTQCPTCIQPVQQLSRESEPLAFSLLDFLRFSKVQYADAYLEKILFRPIPGSEIFEIDNMNGSGYLDSGILVLNDLQAHFADGLIFQYQPLTVQVFNKDTLTVTGAYTVEDLELHEVVENLNSKAFEDLKSDRLNFRGKLSMDFDFVDTLTSETDVNSLEFRINDMDVVQGSAKELRIVGMDQQWKQSVGPFQRVLATIFLGNFKKKFNRPSKYVMHLENMVLDKGWVNYDLMEFYNNQVNVISQGAYHIASGERDIDLLLQRRVKRYDYTEFTSSYCDGGFLTYFNIVDDAEKLAIRNPTAEEVNERTSDFNQCMLECPCAVEDCEDYCKEAFPPLQPTREVYNDISLKLGNKRLKDRCK